MSARNVELHRGAVEAFNTRDMDGFIAYCDPSIVFHSSFAAVGGADYRGHAGLRSFFDDIEEVWASLLRIEPEAYFDLGERTLLFDVLRGRGRHSGAEVAMPVANAARWRDGLMVHFKGYAHREDALRDLGVSADELEPIAP